MYLAMKFHRRAHILAILHIFLKFWTFGQIHNFNHISKITGLCLEPESLQSDTLCHSAEENPAFQRGPNYLGTSG